MSTPLRPTDEREVAGVVADAARAGVPLEIVGAGTKQRAGRPVEASQTLSVRNLRGIVFCEPSEMVISARAGTPLSAVTNELAKHNQQLAFEPIDLGPLLGEPAGQATVGGTIATNASGCRRIIAGAMRDHLLGLRAVNGRGEIFKWGGRVMKNVTGYDLCRTLSGSWGTLSIFTEAVFKAVPRAEETRTVVLLGQPDEIAVEALCAAMGTPYEISGTVHLQAALAARLMSRIGRLGKAVTAMRIENFAESVRYRCGELRKMFAPYGEIEELEHQDSVAFWEEMRQLSFLAGSRNPVWRISTSPKMGPRIVHAISGYMDCKVAYDWSGGLVWLEVLPSADAGSADIRRVTAMRGGHATLLRADVQVRAGVEVFQPLETGLARLSRGIKQAFDPAGILNRGRMYPDL